MAQESRAALLRATGRVAIREWRRIFSSRELILFVLVLPCLVFMLFGAMYWRGVVYDIPIVICDQDHSELSRLLTRSLESTRSLRLAAYVHSVAEIQEGFQKGEWQAAVVLPPDLEAQVKEAKTAKVVVYRNQANIITGNLVYKDVLTVVKTVSAGILMKKLRAAGMTEERALNIANPIRLDVRSLYNPYYNYAHYLLPGLLTAMLQMSLMMTAALVISVEFKEIGVSRFLAESNFNPWAALFGKAIPYLAIGVVQSLLLFFVLLPLVKMAAPISWLPTLGFTFLFLLTCLSLGIMISCLVHDQLTATEIAVFVNTPAFLFSGYTFPIWGMPALHTLMARVMPFTYYLSGLMKIYLMNEPVQAIWQEALILSAYLLVSVWISFRSLAKMMRG
jgi:ABC-2 type transport system permease protein